MIGKPGRRTVLLAGGASGAAWLGSCGSPPCRTPSGGPGLNYCLVESSELRVPKGALLLVGEVALFNLDDNSAAIVARDERGFYALSGVCTHACCVLTLCSDASCTTPATNPGSCTKTPTEKLVRPGAAFVCACHGSQFAASGAVLSGPADRALPAVAVRREADDLLVDLGHPVSAEQRVP